MNKSLIAIYVMEGEEEWNWKGKQIFQRHFETSSQAMVVQTFKPSTLEAEVGGSL